MVSFVLPRKIIYKGDSLEELLNLTSSFSLKNILIITDKVIRNIDYFKRIEEGLNKNGLNLMVYYDVNPEPNIETVNSIYDFIKGEKVDLIVAIGGGSVIDVSKLLRAKIVRPDIRSEDISPFISLNIENKTPLLVTIPTTAGTGSDASFAYVLKIKENNNEIKYASGNYDLVPYESILDINFLKTLPKKQLIITAIDGLANDLEGIVSINSNPLTEGIAIQSARMFFKYLPKVLENREDEESLNYLHLAATLSGIAFSNSGVGLVHAIAHPLGSIFNIPHGMAVAIVMPYVIDFNYKDMNASKMYDEIKTALEHLDGFEKKKSLTEHLIDFYNKIGQPTKLSQIGIDEKTYRNNIDILADLALRDPDLAFNPVYPSIDEIKDILNKIY